MEQIPFIAHEAALSRLERTNRRIWILCIILIIALLGTNAGWIYYESQWEYFETQAVEQDIETGDGDAMVIGIGDYNAENKTKDDTN